MANDHNIVEFRKGQWVKLTKDLTLGKRKSVEAGAVGLHMGPAMIRATADTDPVAHPTLREVHVVDDAGETDVQVAVEHADLVAITDAADIPEARRRTLRPDYVPYATPGQRTE